MVLKPVSGLLAYEEDEYDEELIVIRRLFGIGSDNEY